MCVCVHVYRSLYKTLSCGRRSGITPTFTPVTHIDYSRILGIPVMLVELHCHKVAIIMIACLAKPKRQGAVVNQM